MCRHARPLRKCHAAQRPGQSVSHIVGRASDVFNIAGELCNVDQVPALLCRSGVHHPTQGEGEGLVIRAGPPA
jgi:hypothetical protein